MQNLGHTRSSQQPNHLLLTADTFVRTPLPGMKGCTAVVHAGPALGAKFTQYTAEFETGGELGTTPLGTAGAPAICSWQSRAANFRTISSRLSHMQCCCRRRPLSDLKPARESLGTSPGIP